MVNKNGFIIYQIKYGSNDLSVYGFCTDVKKTRQWTKYLSRKHRSIFLYSKSNIKAFNNSENHKNEKEVQRV